MPDLNPFDEELRKIKAAITTLTQRKSALQRELQWFGSTKQSELVHQLEDHRDRADELRRKCRKFEAGLASCLRERDASQGRIRTVFNPMNWFASDQVQLRRQLKDFAVVLQSLESEKADISLQLQAVERDIDAADITLKRYSAFDLESNKAEFRSLQDHLASKLLEEGLIKTRKQELDVALEPMIIQIQKYTDKRNSIKNVIARAKSLEIELSNASNGYERAMIHQRCERELKVGSPKTLIAKCERELQGVERDLDKITKRAESVVQRALYIINAVVVDGNNLCYQDSQFIGLTALEALIPVLHSKYSVTIVFDAAIRRMLKADDKAIARHFGTRVKVHVVATGQKADLTIIDVAGVDPHTYILSNDRFAEYNDKSAIRERRLVRHEIVNGRILIHDLGIEIVFNLSN